MISKIYDFVKTVSIALGLYSEPRVELIPWTDAHSGNFDDDSEAYTLVVDGNVTNISFAIDEGDANAPDYTKIDMDIPWYVAYYGVSIDGNEFRDIANELQQSAECKQK